MGVNKKDKRLGEEKYNKQGCLMKIIDYIDCCHIIVEFQDKFKYQVNTQYGYFKNGIVTNPYAQTVYNHGILGINYSKKVYLNLVPFRQLQLTEEQNKVLMLEYEKYANYVYEHSK